MDTTSKRMKKDIQNQNHVQRCQIPDLIKDAFGFDETCTGEKLHNLNSSLTVYQKE